MQPDDPADDAVAPFSASQLRRRGREAEAAAGRAHLAFPASTLRNYFVAETKGGADPALTIACLADAIGEQIAELASCFQKSPEQSALQFLQMISVATRRGLEAQAQRLADLEEQDKVRREVEAKLS